MSLFEKVRASLAQRAFFGRIRRLHDESESGAAMTEFAIIFPAQLFLTLAIMQLAQIYIGYVMVQHAAFSAARAASVGDLPINSGGTGDARKAAYRGAAFVLGPLVPVGQEVPRATGDGESISGGDYPAIEWVGNTRYREAYKLMRIDMNGTNERYVGLVLTFDMILSVPVVNHFFAKIGAGGQLGGFITGPRGDYNTASRGTGLTTLRITRNGFAPAPWRKRS